MTGKPASTAAESHADSPAEARLGDVVAPRRYRRKPVPDIEAMPVTESAAQAAAVRRWIESHGVRTHPNTSAMRAGCVVFGWRGDGYAPPGYYVVRYDDGTFRAVSRSTFDATFEPARTPLTSRPASDG